MLQSGPSSPPVALSPFISPSSHTCVLLHLKPSFPHTLTHTAKMLLATNLTFQCLFPDCFEVFFFLLTCLYRPSVFDLVSVCSLPGSSSSFGLLKWGFCGVRSKKFSTNFTSFVRVFISHSQWILRCINTQQLVASADVMTWIKDAAAKNVGDTVTLMCVRRLKHRPAATTLIHLSDII